MKFKTIQEIHLDQVEHNDKIRELSDARYAEYYLCGFWDESEWKNKADVKIYKQLLEIDAKLGTTQSEQLRRCLRYSPRKDLVEVSINFFLFEI